MKILVLVYNIGKTASGRISERIINELSYSGHDIIAVCANLYDKEKVCKNVRVVECRNLLSESSFLLRIRQKLYRVFGLDPTNSQHLWRIRAYICCLKLIKDWNPTFIYCRTTPIDPNFVGSLLSKRYHIPVCQHFTDPIPPPINKGVTPSKTRYSLLRSSYTVLKTANLVSFGTQQMLEFQQSLLDFDITKKAFVSPDSTASVGVDGIFLPTINSDVTRLVYLGSIYWTRNPYPLYSAIEKLVSCGAKIELILYCNKRNHDPEYGWLKYAGFTDNISVALENATVLVDLDGDDECPVFMSSKLKDYIVVNRPILSITPANSPSAELLGDEKTVFITENDEYEIRSKLESIMRSSFSDCDYYSRFKLASKFNPSVIATTLAEQMSSYINER